MTNDVRPYVTEEQAHVVGGARHPSRSESAAGTLVLMGGNIHPGGEALEAFIAPSEVRAGGTLVGITAASADPEGAAALWKVDFTAVGVTNLRFPCVDWRDPRCDADVAAMVADASAVFLGGGDQVKLVASLSGTRTEQAMREAFARGATIGGTSAGAAALTELTMAGGEIDLEGNVVEQYIGPGLGFLGFEAIVDTHFSERRRLRRLFLVIAQHQQLLGLGIDEDTALVVKGHDARVVGSGGVTFVDGRLSVRYSNVGRLTSAARLTLSHLRVGVVGDGDAMNLRARDIVVPDDAALPPASSTLVLP